MIKIARVVHGTSAEGPGLRTAVWAQGCSIRCAGCINPQLFSPNGGQEQDPRVIVQDALSAGSEGLTFLGGEPFDQAAGMAELAESAQAHGLGVICFSGYLHEALAARTDDDRRLLAAVDLLVDGQYRADLPDDSRSLVGSTNQRFRHLSDRYRSFEPTAHRNRIDVRVAKDGTVVMAGFLTRNQLKVLESATSTRRVARAAPPLERK